MRPYIPFLLGYVIAMTLLLCVGFINFWVVTTGAFIVILVAWIWIKIERRCRKIPFGTSAPKTLEL